MAASMPVSRPGRKAGLSQAVPSEARTPEARSCTNAERKRVAFTELRASAEPGTKRGRFGWRIRQVRKDDDEETPSPELEPAVAGRQKELFGRNPIGRWALPAAQGLFSRMGLIRETQAK